MVFKKNRKDGVIKYIQNTKNEKVMFKKSFLDDYLNNNTKSRNRYDDMDYPV